MSKSNKSINENLQQTLDNWKDDGLEKWSEPLSLIPSGIFVRYIAYADKPKKVLARLGGVVMKNDKQKYLVLKGNAGRSFSVQYKNLSPDNYKKKQNHTLIGVYYNPDQKVIRGETWSRKKKNT